MITHICINTLFVCKGRTILWSNILSLTIPEQEFNYYVSRQVTVKKGGQKCACVSSRADKFKTVLTRVSKLSNYRDILSDRMKWVNIWLVIRQNHHKEITIVLNANICGTKMCTGKLDHEDFLAWSVRNIIRQYLGLTAVVGAMTGSSLWT